MCLNFPRGLTVYGYLTEGKEKGEIRKAFQYYLSKNVVDQVLTDPQQLQLGGKKANCTVLFSDIRGFTTISEQLDAKALSELLNEYLTPMTNLVFKNNGTLDKYMGDAIMAFFGAPIEHNNHAVEGCYTALEMMEETSRFCRPDGRIAISLLWTSALVSIGDMSVGNMGSKIRFDYTVMGDNVNLGSRLEGINKEYRTNIIISESTFESARDFIHAREMDLVRVKGKREPVRIYELLGKGPPPLDSKRLIEEFERALKLYRAQEWDEAIAVFDLIRTEIKIDDGPSSMYIQRCQRLKLSPPASTGWDLHHDNQVIPSSMSYSETLADLFRRNRRGIKPGLEATRDLAAALDVDLDALPMVLVAGTNGKGSVSSLIAHLCSKAGIRTGIIAHRISCDSQNGSGSMERDYSGKGH